MCQSQPRRPINHRKGREVKGRKITVHSEQRSAGFYPSVGMRVVAAAGGVIFVWGGRRRGGGSEVIETVAAEVVGQEGWEAEEGEEAEGEAAEMAEGEAEEEVEHFLTAKPFRVASHVLARLGRLPRHRRHPPCVEHHSLPLLCSSVSSPLPPHIVLLSPLLLPLF